jgi:hypothetical protein
MYKFLIFYIFWFPMSVFLRSRLGIGPWLVMVPDVGFAAIAIYKIFKGYRPSRLAIYYVAMFILLCSASYITGNKLTAILASAAMYLRPLLIYIAIRGTKVAWKVPTLVIMLIGLMQQLPFTSNIHQFLGYQELFGWVNKTVDLDSGLVRSFSVFSGPNQFGLVAAIVLIAVLAQNKYTRYDYRLGLLTAFCLYFSYSRSAWIVAVIGFAVIIINKKHRQLSKNMVIVGLIIMTMVGGLIATNYRSLILHDSITAGGQNSTDQHLSAKKAGIEDIKSRPTGFGLGSAGPASRYNAGEFIPISPISDNQFIQAGQELGIIGLIIVSQFLLLLIVLSRKKLDTLLFIAVLSVGLSFSHSLFDQALCLVLVFAYNEINSPSSRLKRSSPKPKALSRTRKLSRSTV